MNLPALLTKLFPLWLLVFVLNFLFGCTQATSGQLGAFFGNPPKSTYAFPLSMVTGDPDTKGALVVESSRDATLNLDEQGADGSSRVLTFTASASDPLRVGGDIWMGVEGQRQKYVERILDRVDRRIDRLEDLIAPLVMARAQFSLDRASAAASQPSGPGQLDRLLERMDRFLEKIEQPAAAPPE